MYTPKIVFFFCCFLNSDLLKLGNATQFFCLNLILLREINLNLEKECFLIIFILGIHGENPLEIQINTDTEDKESRFIHSLPACAWFI